jgi:hypothetical protein
VRVANELAADVAGGRGGRAMGGGYGTGESRHKRCMSRDHGSDAGRREPRRWPEQVVGVVTVVGAPQK